MGKYNQGVTYPKPNTGAAVYIQTSSGCNNTVPNPCIPLVLTPSLSLQQAANKRPLQGLLGCPAFAIAKPLHSTMYATLLAFHILSAAPFGPIIAWPCCHTLLVVDIQQPNHPYACLLCCCACHCAHQQHNTLTNLCIHHLLQAYYYFTGRGSKVVPYTGVPYTAWVCHNTSTAKKRLRQRRHTSTMILCNSHHILQMSCMPVLLLQQKQTYAHGINTECPP